MSFPRYPKYKDSGVEWLGELPAHWQTIRLRYVSRCLDGQRVPLNAAERADRQGDIPYWGANSIVGYVDGALFDEDLIFLGEDGAPFFDRTKSVAFFSQGKVWPNNHIHVLRPNIRESARYVVHALNVTDFAPFIDGSTRDKLTQSAMNDIPLPWPPLPEQILIATFLDGETAKIDALVTEQQRLIDLLKEKRQAVISHAVTKGLNPGAPMKSSNVEWLGEVPAHWEIRRVSSLSTKITNGYVGPTRDIFVDDGIRYLQSLHIKDNKIRFDVPYFVSAEWSQQHSKSVLEVGDVLIVQTGDIGQAAVVTDEFAGCNCHALIIVSPVREVVEGAWIALVLKAEFGLQYLLSIQTGALHPHLNCGDVKDVPIPLPSLVEQRQIIKRVSEQTRSLDALISEAERAIELLQARRTALISAAVTGQIDVRATANRTAA